MPAKSTTLVCLIGEQPIPNLLPIFHFSPSHVVLVMTRLPRLVPIVNALKQVLQEKNIITTLLTLSNEYSISDCYTELEEQLRQKDIVPTHINITGGTKPMSLAAFLLAEKNSLPVYYLESNREQKNQLYESAFDNHILKQVSVQNIHQQISLVDFIRSFGYETTERQPRDALEIAVSTAIRACGLFEMRTGIQIDAQGNSDIDIMLRYEDRYAMIEVKQVARELCKNCGKKVKPKPKQALEQVVTISEQRIFGTYTNRILILHCAEDEVRNIDGITDMCKILNTKWILLHDDYKQHGRLSTQDCERLYTSLFKVLGIQGSPAERGE